jgi:hypothetical protein
MYEPDGRSGPHNNTILFGEELKSALAVRGRETSAKATELFGENALNPRKLRDVVVDYVSRMEYALSEGQRFSAPELVTTILTGPPEASAEFLEYLRNVASPHSQFYRVLTEVSGKPGS